MTKLSKRKLDSEKLGHFINNLWSAFTLMPAKEDIRLLFKDLFTHTEYKMFAKRLEIARRLIAQETYKDIQKKLSVTSRTVTVINNILAEKGQGLRKADEYLRKIEDGYLKNQKEKTKNLENPFRAKVRGHFKTVLGEGIKAGIISLDKTISKKIKQSSAKKQLPV